MNHNYLNIWCRPKNDIKWPYNAWAKFTKSSKYILDTSDPEIVEKFHQWLQKYLYDLWNPEDWDMRTDDPPLYVTMSYDNEVSGIFDYPPSRKLYYKAWKNHRTKQYDIIDKCYGETT